jgi:hypothetical protein
MSNYPIYRRNEPRSLPSEPTTRDMTEEEMIRIYGKVFVPDRDPSGKVIKPPPVTPYKTKERIVEEKPKIKQGGRVRKFQKHLHVTKELIATELAAGKSLAQIAEENGMTRNHMFHRAELFGLHTPKERIRGAGKYHGK